jgi:hypothetical protein
MLMVVRTDKSSKESAMREVTANVSFEQPADASLGAFLIRYGLGALMILDGVVMLIVSPGGLGVDGFAMAVGGGLSVVLFNCLFRLSLSSESDRAQEERARAYFDQSWRVARRGARPAASLGASCRRRHPRAGAGAAAGTTDGRIGGRSDGGAGGGPARRLHTARGRTSGATYALPPCRTFAIAARAAWSVDVTTSVLAGRSLSRSSD